MPDDIILKSEDGELLIVVDKADSGLIVVSFSQPVSWIGLPQDQAIKLASQIMEHAGCQILEVREQ